MSIIINGKADAVFSAINSNLSKRENKQFRISLSITMCFDILFLLTPSQKILDHNNKLKKIELKNLMLF